jgi:HK97 family phage prohead protease
MGAMPLKFKGRLNVKSASSGAVVIEGFANKAVVDRSEELIVPEAWPKALDNFMKNPIMLFNHGLDPVVGTLPVGKFTEIEPRKDGLFVRGKMSQIKSGPIADIRQLVEERMLGAFSVGFNPKNVENPDADGVKKITDLELAEISVVGIPMNQDSLFGVVGKDGKPIKFKSYFEITQSIVKSRGSAFAESAQACIDGHCLKGAKRADLIEDLALKCGVGVETIYDLLAGNFKMIPNQFVQGFEEAIDFVPPAVVDMKTDDKKEDDEETYEEDESKGEEVDEGKNKEEGEKEGDEAQDDSNDEGEEDTGEADKEKAVKEVRSGDGSGSNRHTHNVRIDDETGNGRTLDTQGDGPDHSHTISEGKFAAGGEDNHTHPNINPVQSSEGGDDDKGKDGDDSENENDEEKNIAPEKIKSEFQQCVISKLEVIMNDGNVDPDEAIAVAIKSAIEDGKVKKDYQVTEEDLKTFIAFMEGETKQAEQPDEPEGGTPIKTEKEDLSGNSFDQAKQTNVMLGAVVSEIQNMREDFRSLVDALTTRLASDDGTGKTTENTATITDDDSAGDETDEEKTEVEVEVEEEEDDEAKDEKSFTSRMKRIDSYLSKVEQSLIDNGFNG